MVPQHTKVDTNILQKAAPQCSPTLPLTFFLLSCVVLCLLASTACCFSPKTFFLLLFMPKAHSNCENLLENSCPKHRVPLNWQSLSIKLIDCQWGARLFIGFTCCIHPKSGKMEEDARSKFLNKLNALYSKKPQNTYLVPKFGKFPLNLFIFIQISNLDYMNRLQRLTELNDPQTQRNSTDQKLLKNCCLATDPTTNQLKLCKTGTNLSYVALEDLYDILLGYLNFH